VDLNPTWVKGYLRRGLAELHLKKYEQAETTYKQGLELEPNNQQLLEGLQSVKEMKISNPPEGPSETSEKDKDKFYQQAMSELMNDPETSQYFQDPEFVKKLNDIKKNPQNAKLHMNDPKVKKAIGILMAKFGSKGASGASKGPGHGNTGAAPKHADESEKMEEEPPVHEKKTQARPETHTTNAFEKEQKKSSGGSAEEEKTLGNDEYKKRKFEKALYHYDQAIELNPNEPIYYTNKAIVYLEMREADKAIEACDKAVEVCKAGHYDFKKLGKAFAKKASAYVLKHNYDEAIEFFRQSLLENHDDKVKEEMKKVENIKKDLETKSYIDPKHAEEHRLKGNDFYNQGKYPESIKEYEEAIKRDPNQARLHFNLATALVKMIDYPSALHHIIKCLELDSNYIKAYAKKGDLHFYLKEYHKALEAYEKGLKLDPNNVDCQRGIEKTNMTIFGGNSTETKEEREQRIQKAMADPEIQALIQDPQISQIITALRDKPNDPTSLAALQDPEISKKINKLIASGIIGTS
jgi:stress-induced-phosphoprotein 1